VVGVLETASVSVLPLAYKDVVALGILLLILVLKPQGLFVRRPVAHARAGG
jgi:branched-subunit amino acid ABC-type transport system permease component